MLQEYIKLNYFEEENLCREVFHQLHYVGFMSKGYSVGLQFGRTTLLKQMGF